MVIIKTSKNFLKTVLLSVLAISIGVGIFSFFRHLDISAPSQGSGSIEIFDIGKGEVIKQAESDLKTRREAEKLLKRITGLYLKFKPLPDKGLVIRIPLEPPSRIKNKWLNDCGIVNVDALFVLFPEEGAPYLLVLDDKQRPWFFNSRWNTYFHTLCKVSVRYNNMDIGVPYVM